MRTEFMLAPNGWPHLKPHPLAKAASFIEKGTVEALAKFIKENGYDDTEHIVLIRNGRELQTLDGILRLAAAIEAGVTPSFRMFNGPNPAAFVAKKAFRQHLSTSQRAIVAAGFATAKVGNQSKSTDTTIPEAARIMNVGEGVVKDAKKVLAEGSPALQEAVKDGTITVTDAARAATKPIEQQDEAVEKVRAKKAKKVAKVIPTLEDTDSPPPPKHDGIVRDDEGTVVPQRLIPAFNLRRIIRATAHALSKASTAALELDNSPTCSTPLQALRRPAMSLPRSCTPPTPAP